MIDAYVLGQIYRILSFSVYEFDGPNQAELSNAQIFPLRGITLMTSKAHQLKKITPDVTKRLAEMYEKIDLQDLEIWFDKPLPLPEQGKFQLGYMKAIKTSPIAKYRKMQNLSQAELANAVGADQRSVSRWENNIVTPRPAMLAKIAQVLHCTMEDLISE